MKTTSSTVPKSALKISQPSRMSPLLLDSSSPPSPISPCSPLSFAFPPLPTKNVRFYERVTVAFTFSSDHYDRSSVAMSDLNQADIAELLTMRAEMQMLTIKLYKRRKALEMFAKTRSFNNYNYNYNYGHSYNSSSSNRNPGHLSMYSLQKKSHYNSEMNPVNDLDNGTGTDCDSEEAGTNNHSGGINIKITNNRHHRGHHHHNISTFSSSYQTKSWKAYQEQATKLQKLDEEHDFIHGTALYSSSLPSSLTSSTWGGIPHRDFIHQSYSSRLEWKGGRHPWEHFTVWPQHQWD